MLRDSWFYWS